jgi:hypothetical protein
MWRIVIGLVLCRRYGRLRARSLVAFCVGAVLHGSLPFFRLLFPSSFLRFACGDAPGHFQRPRWNAGIAAHLRAVPRHPAPHHFVLLRRTAPQFRRAGGCCLLASALWMLTVFRRASRAPMCPFASLPMNASRYGVGVALFLCHTSTSSAAGSGAVLALSVLHACPRESSCLFFLPFFRRALFLFRGATDAASR